MTGLVDIDVLAERVRSVGAKSFIREAVDCYKAGAYRSCVVATWIALVYDFVDKFRDLALAGDAAAKELVGEFDRIQRERDTAAALKFEKDGLVVARDAYELISAQEQTDLKRLFEDRNRFSHPNLNQDSEVLVASAEQARNHLRNAVEHVMQRPPVQGKVALNEIREAVDSPYFPRKVDDAVSALSATPLARAKRVVVRDFFLGCTASLFLEKLQSDSYDRHYAAASACHRMHREIVDEVISDKLALLFDKVPDDGLPYLIVLLARVPEYIRRVSDAVKVKLRAYTEQIPDSQIAVINFAAELEFLKQHIVKRLSSLTPAQLRDFTQHAVREPAQVVVSRAIEMYESAQNWDSANTIASAIWEKMLGVMTSRDAVRVIRAGVNDEVKYSFHFPVLVEKLMAAKLLTSEEVKAIATELGLDVLNKLYLEEVQETGDPSVPF
jgi:hypothetical protein